jgi:signal transduction histidine kinase
MDPLGSVQLVATIDEAASALRHDLRNKFGSVRSAEYYIRRRLQSTEAWQAEPRLEEMSGIIRDEIRAANELLDQRQQLQHLFVAAPSRIDAAECVRRAVACTRMDRDCRVEIELRAEAGNVVADAAELALAVRCLLENAVEALGESGVVHVRARLETSSRYVIEIEDAGVGIPPSQRAVVLAPFYTTKPERAGLGLNIARRIAERYSGTLAFRDVAVGTTVALELDLDTTDA